MVQDKRGSLATRRRALALFVAVGASFGCAKQAVSFDSFDPNELMARWNATVDSVNVTVTGFGDFRWTVVDQFPHPTFKGGSEESYTLFAFVLVTFYEQDDNFDYLAQNHLFKQNIGMFGGTTTFQLLTETMLASNLVASAPTRQKLSDFASRIAAIAFGGWSSKRLATAV
jgi:hypothetical protein